MMNSSAGEPNRASGSASSQGGTCPCGQTSGRSLTAAYSARATVRRVGSESKQRSGGSVHGIVGISLFLRVMIRRIVRLLHPKLAQDMRRHFGLTCPREDALH